MQNPCIITQVLPHRGLKMLVNEYVDTVVSLGYTRHQAVSSLGGSVNGGSAKIQGGYITRY